jgi:hypothetical protein
LSKSERGFTSRYGDLSLSLAQSKTENHPNATAIAFDILMPIKEKKR